MRSLIHGSWFRLAFALTALTTSARADTTYTWIKNMVLAEFPLPTPFAAITGFLIHSDHPKATAVRVTIFVKGHGKLVQVDPLNDQGYTLATFPVRAADVAGVPAVEELF
jgi:hypothetical protein